MSEAGKISRKVGWKYDEKEVREDVRLKLPEIVQLRVFEVTSGDSGKQYWVQLLWQKSGGPLYNNPTTISLCTCPQGTFQEPLSIWGIKPCCKHAENLLAFLREKGEK